MVQIGALVAAGHGPPALGEWTWPQIEVATRAVQAYHLDLASRLVTGKSPAYEDAPRILQDPRPDEVTPEEAERIARAELEEIRRFAMGPAAEFGNVVAGGSIGIVVTRGS